MSNKKILIFFGLTLFGLTLFAQQKDFKSWNSLSAEIGLSKKLDFILEQELRFENNASFLGAYLAIGGFSYDVSKKIKVQGFYRLNVNRDPESGNELRQRFYGDVTVKEEVLRFTLSYRIRYQIIKSPQNDNDFTYYNPQHLRQKFQIKYDIPRNKLEPYTACELYHGLNNPVKKIIETTRLTLGFDFPILSLVDGTLYYRIEQENDLIHKSKTNYILGFGLNVKL